MSESVAEAAALLIELEHDLLAWREVADDTSRPAQHQAKAARWVSALTRLIECERTRLSALRRGDDPC